MSEVKCFVVPLNGETREYGCGHTGPATWSLNLFGKVMEVPAEIQNDGRCGQCHADEFIQCRKCGEPIGPGENCVMTQQGEIFCGSIDCGHTPINTDPGIWDGKVFQNDALTGRGFCTFQR